MKVKNPDDLSNPVQANDAQLAAAARLGDRKAFVEIVHRYQNLVTGVTLAILRDFSMSEDAAQEAFVRAWQKLTTLKDGAKLRPWLCQIARNTALNHSKKKLSTDPLEPSLIDPAPRPDEIAISRDEQARVLTALDSLPEKYRLPLVLYYREDQSIQSVAKALSQSQPTIRKQISRGRNLLKKELAGLIKSTLPRTAPGPVFTATVAGLIGGMLKPTAVAATAFSAEPLATSATAMTSSKLTFTTAAIITAVCLPVGYTAPTFFPEKETSSQTRMTPNNSSLPKRTKSAPTLSPIAMEWQELLASCQNNPKAFPDLYLKVSQIPGGLRREAFQSLLLAEWVRLDPVNGLTFVRSLDNSDWQQKLFTKEWLNHDADAAIAGLLSSGPGWDIVEDRHLPDLKKGKGWGIDLGRNLDLVVEKAPGRLQEVMNAIPGSSYWNPISAIEKYFQIDPEGARLLALSLTGRKQKLTWIGIANARAEENFHGALEWAKEQNDPSLRATLVIAVISSEGRRNPSHALEYLKTAPPALDRNGSSIIMALARKDFPAALKWSAENPTSEFKSGLNNKLHDQLQRDPEALIDTLHSTGALKATAPMVAQLRILNESTETQTLVWNKLLKLEPSSGAEYLRREIASRTPPKAPYQMMSLIDQLPDPQERETLTKKVVQIVAELGKPESTTFDPFASEKDPEAFSEILTKSPKKWQDLLIEASTRKP